tara:strand:- start:8135 stop:8383 length:249 start_codon:yes stop_codon:yes gene_type:complete
LVNKVTPTHTRDWYIKWFASFFIVVGVMLTSNNIYPYNLLFHFVGLAGWLIVAMLWNDRALLMINAVSISFIANGLVQHYVK